MASGEVFGEDPHAAKIAEKYAALGRAALSIDCLAKGTTSFTILTLYVLCQYYGLADRATSECRWLLNGFMTRMAFSVRRLEHACPPRPC